ncbi:MAG TPA: class I adenylate-forming enzyme family protein [Terrimicrobiaceae bacterium]
METSKHNREDEPRNRENNPVLERWEEVFSSMRRRPAILAPDGTIWRTFSSIEEEAKQWMNRLARQSSRGAISLQIGNRAEWPALLLATWRSGRILLPLDRDLLHERRQRIEALCGASVRIESRGTELDLVPLSDSQALADSRIDLFKFTSGTTCEPRAISFRAAQLLADCDNVCDSMGLREDDLNYGIVAFDHSYGFSNLITPLLCRGIPLVPAWDIIPRAILQGLKSSSATVLAGVPAIFRNILDFPEAGRCLRLCISAGALLAGDVARRFFDSWGRKIHSFYGSSECGGICYDPSETPEVSTGYVGLPLKDVDVCMEDGELSQAWVRSRAVGLGYWPPLADENLREGAFRPVDLLKRSGEGYMIAGRVSDLINVAGRKVNPHEIERILRMSPHVRQVVVLGLPAIARGEEVVACVEGRATEAELRTLCANNLPAWQVPRRWFFLEEIPLNARGKISRAELRSRLVLE